MNSVDLRLLDLLELGESPVYSAYRWLSQQYGRALSMAEFFRLLVPLLEDDVVRLWAVDVATAERSRWMGIPSDFEERYAQIADLDDSFDPFALSLTLGPAADLEARPDWEADFDFEQRRFVVTAKTHAVDQAQGQIRRLFPGLELAEEDREVIGDRIRITGSVSELSPSGS